MTSKHTKIIFVIPFLLMIVAVAFLFLLDSIDNSFVRSNLITGNDVLTQVNIIQPPALNCSFHLNQGLNMVSFVCIGTGTPRDEVLAPINDSYESIFYYNAADPNDPWKSYNPSLPDWTVQQINTMSRYNGYFIYMKTSADYNLEGGRRTSFIPLKDGWNLIGYPSRIPQYISEMFGDIEYTEVKTYQNSTWLIYIPGRHDNTMDTLYTNEGYWVNSSENQSLNISVV